MLENTALIILKDDWRLFFSDENRLNYGNSFEEFLHYFCDKIKSADCNELERERPSYRRAAMDHLQVGSLLHTHSLFAAC